MLEKFTGRRQILETLQQDLTAGTGSVVARPISVYADGGVGKTALAVELGWRLFEARQFDFVLFLNASTPETLDAELASLCASNALDLPEQTAKEQETRRAGAMRYLSTVENGRLTLLILDNVDSDEARKALRELLPKVVTCAVLITSRFSGNLSGVRRQELGLFDIEESREYLRTHLQPGLLAKASGQAVLDAVAEEVDHLPLALELVVSYMHETNQSAAEWLEEWRKSPAPTLTFQDADGVNYPVSLAQVWEQSVERLSSSARDLLHVLAWVASRPAALPLEAFKTSGDWLNLRAALSELTKASIIGWPPGADEISIHRVLQAVTRRGLSEEEATASLTEAILRIEATLPHSEWNEAGWREWDRLASHVRVLLHHVEGCSTEPAAARIMNRYGLFLCYRAQYAEAELLLRRALSIEEQRPEPEHHDLATVLKNLALLLRETNRLREAEPLLRRALLIRESLLGPKDPYVAGDLDHLATLLQETNRLEEAEPLFRRAPA
jgi:tetratricopeptide (TPR) repeat protein